MYKLIEVLIKIHILKHLLSVKLLLDGEKHLSLQNLDILIITWIEYLRRWELLFGN